MSLAVLRSRALAGMEAPPVNVEVHLANGLPGITMVGMKTPISENMIYLKLAHPTRCNTHAMPLNQSSHPTPSRNPLATALVLCQIHGPYYAQCFLEEHGVDSGVITELLEVVKSPQGITGSSDQGTENAGLPDSYLG